MHDNFLETNESSFPLFSVVALQSSGQKGFSSPLIGPSDPLNLLSCGFPNPIMFPDVIEPIRKKRGRKVIPISQKSMEDPAITLKEIIENQEAGIPTEAEIAMKKDRIKKMHEKRAENRRLKKNAALFKEAIHDQESQLESHNSTSLTKRSIGEDKLLLGLNEPSSTSAPQIIIKNGKPVIYTSNSFQLDKVGSTGLTLADNKKVKRVTSMSFRSRNHTEKWTAEETTKFFKAIEIFGADFSMIAKLFPNRNRAQVKNKFRKEEKESPELIEHSFRKNKLFSHGSLMNRIENLNKNLQFDGASPQASLGFPKDVDSPQIGIDFDMDTKIMNQIQEMYQNGIKAQQANDFSLNKTSLLKGFELRKPSELLSGPIMTPNLETMPELKIEACSEEVEPTSLAPVKINEPEKNRNLLFNLLKK